MAIRLSAPWALLVALTSLACGSEDEDAGGGSPSAAGAKASCNAYCDGTVDCELYAYMDPAECRYSQCDNLDQAPAACADAFKNYYDCVNAKSDVCDESGCELDIDACM